MAKLHTYQCSALQIKTAHAPGPELAVPLANGLLFLKTELMLTLIYSLFIPSLTGTATSWPSSPPRLRYCCYTYIMYYNADAYGRNTPALAVARIQASRAASERQGGHLEKAQALWGTSHAERRLRTPEHSRKPGAVRMAYCSYSQ